MRDNMLDNVTSFLSLHWLPIPLCTIYKLMLLTYKYLNGEGTMYLKDLLSLYTTKDCLRSASQELLQQKRFKLDALVKEPSVMLLHLTGILSHKKYVRKRKLMLSRKL